VRFTEIDVFGVYIAPMSLMMVVAWLVTIALRGEHGPASHAKHHAHITGDGFHLRLFSFRRPPPETFCRPRRAHFIVKCWLAHHV